MRDSADDASIQEVYLIGQRHELMGKLRELLIKP